MLTQWEIQRVEKLVTCFLDFLQARVFRWLGERPDVTILQTLSADGTPITTVETHSVDWDKFKIRRTGRRCREYLVMRCWLQDPEGSVTCLFDDVKRMSDKTALTHYNGIVRLWKGARAHGHRGFLIAHHVFDRAVHEAVTRRMDQRQAAFEYHLTCTMGSAAVLLILKTWTTSGGCVLHDLQNALKWAVFHMFGDASILRDCWVVFAALRSSMDQLISNTARWLMLHVRFDHHPYHAEDMDKWWTLLRVCASMLATFQLLKPIFTRGRLYIDPACETMPDIWPTLVNMMLYIFNFKRWSTARWGGASKSCLNVTLAQSCGLESLVRGILEDKKQSDYHLKGFLRLTPSVRRMFAITAGTSRVTDGALATLKDDDRLVRRLPEIDQMLGDAASYCIALPEFIIEILAAQANFSQSELRTEIFLSVISQLCYARWRLQPVRGLPWCLSMGDVYSNLEWFARQPRPDDNEVVPQRIHDLLSDYCEPEELVEPVSMLAETAWSSKTVEDPHTHASKLARGHDKYSQKTLTARTLLKMASPFFRQDALRNQIEHLETRLMRLRRKQPMKITGRHAYVRGLVAVSRIGTQNLAPRQASSVAVIKNHGKMWAKVSRERKRAFEQSAEDLRSEARENTAKTIASVRERLNVKRIMLLELCRPDAPRLRMTHCRFSQSECADFEALFNSGQYTENEVERRRLESIAPLCPPGDAEVATLDLMHTPQKKKAPYEDWVPWVARHRVFFKHTIFKFPSDERGGIFQVRHRIAKPCRCDDARGSSGGVYRSRSYWGRGRRRWH